MNRSIKGRTIVVSGAGSGIGLGILTALLAEGVNAYGLFNSDSSGEKIRALGAKAIKVDIREPEQLVGAIRKAREESGQLDGLVSNAGLTLTAPFLDAGVAMWDQLWRTNQRSVLIGCQAAARILVEDGRKGALVNVSSVHARASDVDYEAYAGTKGAIVAMGRAMAWSLGPHGIRVNTLSPGLTMTETVAKVADDPATAKLFRSWHANGKVSTVDEMGQLAVFLLSDASSALTGTEIIADQGTTARLCNLGV